MSLRRWLGAWVWLWGMLLFGSACAEGLPETIVRVKPSIVAVGTYKATNSPPFTMRGTGFVVGNGNLVATNAHVIAGATDQDGSTLTVQIRPPGATDSQLRRVKLLATDRDHDLAVLQMEGPALPHLVLGAADPVVEGLTVAFTGFPIGAALGFAPVTHRGMIAAITPIVLPAANSQRLNEASIKRVRAGQFLIYQLDATAYPGNSGSPLFHPDTGEVVGIINMVFVKGSKEAALTHPSGISYAIPVSFLQALVAEIGR